MLFGVFAFYGNMRMKAKVLVWTILLHHHVPSNVQRDSWLHILPEGALHLHRAKETLCK